LSLKFAAWAECIAGAMPKYDYISTIKKAGFKKLNIVSENAYTAPGLDKRLNGKIIRVKIRAYK
jgi:hypothetical protein